MAAAGGTAGRGGAGSAAPDGMGGPAIWGVGADGAARVPNWASDGYRAATSFGMMPLPQRSKGSDKYGQKS